MNRALARGSIMVTCSLKWTTKSRGAASAARRRGAGAQPAWRRGVAVVELAVLLPFLLFLFVVCIDFCRVFYYSQTLYNCAYSGALYGSGTAGRSSGTAEDAVKQAAVAEGTTLSPALTSSQVSYTPADSQNEITVTVTYNYTSFTGFPGIPTTMTLTRTVKMRVSPVASP